MILKEKNLWSTSSTGDAYFSNVMLLLHANGNFTDSSTNATTVTPYNSATTNNSVYKFGTGSLDFTTSSSYASFPNSNLNLGTGDWTIELWWYQPASIEAYGVIFDIDSSSNFFIGFSPDTTALRVYSAPNSVNYMSNSHGMTAGNWYHLAWVRSGSTITIYKNGTSLGSVGTGSTSYSPASGYNTAYLSTYGASLAAYRSGGNIDEFRITKGVARYTNNFTVPADAFPNS